MSTSSFVRAASSYTGARMIIDALFEGITLSADQDARARAIIAQAFEVQLGVTLRNTDGWERLMQLNAARDAALRDLLTGERDRAVFDSHSADLRRRQAESRPESTTAPTVLRIGVVPTQGGTLEIVFRADGMSDEMIQGASCQLVSSFRSDADHFGVSRIATVADILDRRDEFATYSRTATRAFGRQPDGAWVPLRAT